MSKRSPRITRPLAYLLVLAPWITEYIEEGRFPSDLSGMMTEIVLSVMLGVGVYLYLRSRQKTAQHQSEIKRLSHIDIVSSLGNPQALEEVLVREIARARRMARPLSFVFLDLDDFKAINTRFGHTAGNSVLQVIGQTLQKTIRTDIDSAFRYGGDEFLIILPEADKPQAYLIAQRINHLMAALRPPTIPLKTLQASLGIAQLMPDQKAMDLLSLMDKAMRYSKTQGKNLIFDVENMGKEL